MLDYQKKRRQRESSGGGKFKVWHQLGVFLTSKTELLLSLCIFTCVHNLGTIMEIHLCNYLAQFIYSLLRCHNFLIPFVTV